jgi:hypothetical protein
MLTYGWMKTDWRAVELVILAVELVILIQSIGT